MKRSLLSLLQKVIKPTQASRQVMRSKAKKTLLSKDALERFRKNSIDNVKLKNPPVSKGLFDAWLADSKAGLTPPPPWGIKNYKVFNKHNKINNDKKIEFLKSSEFDSMYKDSINTHIGYTPIRFLDKKNLPGNWGQYNHKPSGLDLGKISVLERTNPLTGLFSGFGKRKQISTGVHELKHAAQYGNTGMLAPQFPSLAINKIINANKIKIPKGASKEYKDWIEYLRKPEEVSARLEEIRAMRKTGSIFEKLRINNSVPMRRLKQVFGSVEKVEEMEKLIWGLAPIGVTGLLSNLKED